MMALAISRKPNPSEPDQQHGPHGFGLPVTPVISGGLAVTIVTGRNALPVIGSGAAPI